MSMFLIPNRSVIISAVTCCLLLLSNGSFANNQKNLEDAIAQNRFEDAEKALLASDIDVKKIDYFYPLPSAKMSELLLDGGLDLRRFFGLVMRSSVYNDEKFTKQQELVKITLAKGLNPNFLLQVAVSQTLSVGGSNHDLQLFNQESYLKMALDAGASFAKAKLPDYWSTSKLVSLEALTLMFDNGLDPNQVFVPLVREWGCEKDDVKNEQRKKILEMVLEKGGSANKLLELAVTRRVEIGENRYTLINICAKDDELIKLALQHGAKFSEIKFSDYWSMPKLASPEALTLMLDNGLGTNKTLAPIVEQWGCGKDAAEQEQRKKLLEMVLERGGSVNKLLELVITREMEIGKNSYASVNICAKDGELIRLALQHGAKFSEIKFSDYWFPYWTASSEVLTLMIDNLMDPGKIFGFLVRDWGSDTDESKQEERKKLLDAVLAKGGSADKLLNVVLDHKGEEELIAIALKNGAKLSKIKAGGGKVRFYPTSVEWAKLMLENPFDPKDSLDKALLITKIVNKNVQDYDSVTRKPIVSDVLVAKRKDLIELVVKKGADLKKIRYFAELPSLELSKFLLDKGLDRDTFINLIAKVVPIKYGFDIGHFEIDNELVKKKDDLAKTLFGAEVKVPEMDKNILSELLQFFDMDYGSNGSYGHVTRINSLNANGKTQLMLTAEIGDVAGVEGLIDDGADPNIKDNNGKTALDLAREKGVANEYLEELLKPKQVENGDSNVIPKDSAKEESKKSDHAHEEL